MANKLPKLISILTSRAQTLCLAESCTGGYIAHLITSHAGASNYFKGSIVSYDNGVKENVLGVSANSLLTEGAVSEQVVKEMLAGLLQEIQADYGLAVSGIMGPDGGSEIKPVGTVWIAAGSKDFIKTHQLKLRFGRMRNIQVTATMALDFLRKIIQNNIIDA